MLIVVVAAWNPNLRDDDDTFAAILPCYKKTLSEKATKHVCANAIVGCFVVSVWWLYRLCILRACKSTQHCVYKKRTSLTTWSLQEIRERNINLPTIDSPFRIPYFWSHVDQKKKQCLWKKRSGASSNHVFSSNHHRDFSHKKWIRDHKENHFFSPRHRHTSMGKFSRCSSSHTHHKLIMSREKSAKKKSLSRYAAVSTIDHLQP